MKGVNFGDTSPFLLFDWGDASPRPTGVGAHVKYRFFAPTCASAFNVTEYEAQSQFREGEFQSNMINSIYFYQI